MLLHGTMAGIKWLQPTFTEMEVNRTLLVDGETGTTTDTSHKVVNKEADMLVQVVMELARTTTPKMAEVDVDKVKMAVQLNNVKATNRSTNFMVRLTSAVQQFIFLKHIHRAAEFLLPFCLYFISL
jgi:hypothetical protein